jgi:hypothetical protein
MIRICGSELRGSHAGAQLAAIQGSVMIMIQAIEHRGAGGLGLVQLDRAIVVAVECCKAAEGTFRSGAADSGAPDKTAQKEITQPSKPAEF